MISGHLEDIVSHYRNLCVYQDLHVSAEISAHHLQLKCMGGHFFMHHPSHILPWTVLVGFTIPQMSLFSTISQDGPAEYPSAASWDSNIGK